METVWLILPTDLDLDDYEEWVPASVFATWELAVSRLREIFDVRVEHKSDERVECVAVRRDGDELRVRIERLPVEHMQMDIEEFRRRLRKTEP